jgi:Ca2+-binding EF-hand superfamily protein
MLADLFQKADTDGNGTLDRCEFAAVLRSQNIGISERLVNRMLADADDNEDGVIQYSCASTALLRF